jgi:hypothetical protein
MVDTRHTDQRLSEELANTRAQLRDYLLLLSRDLDIGRYINQSVQDHTFEWATIAFITGWLFSRLPARKKKIYYYSPDHESGKGRSHKKENKLWKIVWNTSKPIIAAYLAKGIAKKAMTREQRKADEMI